jgi:hypothetical protein
MEDDEKKLWDAVGKLVQQYEDHSSVEKIVEEDEDA